LIGTVLWGAVIGLASCGIWCLWNGIRSRKWQTAPGVVLHSDIEGEDDPDDSHSYRVCILYRYEVGGQEYLSKRVYFGQAVLWTSSFDRLLRKMIGYDTGTKVKVYFHSRRPSLSVLQPGMSLEAWVMAILGFGLLALFVMYNYRSHLVKERKTSVHLGGVPGIGRFWRGPPRWKSEKSSASRLRGTLPVTAA
jgi:hypothetical protein